MAEHPHKQWSDNTHPISSMVRRGRPEAHTDIRRARHGTKKTPSSRSPDLSNAVQAIERCSRSRRWYTALEESELGEAELGACVGKPRTLGARPEALGTCGGAAETA